MASQAVKVRVADGFAEGLDTDGGRWQVICETHGCLVSVESRSVARADADAARDAGFCEWCEECMTEANAVEGIVSEATRLIGVTAQHFDKMLREATPFACGVDTLRDTRPTSAEIIGYGKQQRGNAGAYSHCDGVIAGLCTALRISGDSSLADGIERDLEVALDSIRQKHGIPTETWAEWNALKSRMRDAEPASV